MNISILFRQKLESNIKIIFAVLRLNVIIEIRSALSDITFVYNLIRDFSNFQTHIRFSGHACKSTDDVRSEKSVQPKSPTILLLTTSFMPRVRLFQTTKIKRVSLGKCGV